MLPSLLIIDDFLADPHGARAAALGLGYDPATRKGNYPGTLSSAPLGIAGLEAAVAQIIGVPVVPQPGTTHGHCRLTLKGDRGVSGVHIDPCFYSGILYLSRDEDARGGTDFFRHKRTGTERGPTSMEELHAMGYASMEELHRDIIENDSNDESAWELTMRVPMRFNRLVLLRPWFWHTAGEGFGDSLDNGRLVYLMFFGGGR